jgi:cysteine desulfuration protein SufE
MTINEIQDQIIREFSGFQDEFKKYEHIVKTGKCHQVGDANLRTEEHLIPGCQSNAWLKAQLQNGKLFFIADSEALITRGIIALLLRVFNNQTPEDIAAADLYFIDRIGLASNLSPSRANGLAAVVKNIKSIAHSQQIIS